MGFFDSTIGKVARGGLGIMTQGLSEQFFNRPEETSAGDLFPQQQNQQLIDQANRLEDPSFGFGQFRQLAQSNAGTADQTLQATAATGGSERLAQTRQRQNVQESANNIMDQFGQFRLQAQQQAGQLRQQAIGNQMQAQRAALNQRNRRSQATRSAFGAVTDQLNAIGGALFGAATGGAGGGANTNIAGSVGGGQGFGNLRMMMMQPRQQGGAIDPLSQGFIPRGRQVGSGASF